MVEVNSFTLKLGAYFVSLLRFRIAVIFKSSMQAVKKISHMISIHCVPLVHVNQSLQEGSGKGIEERNSSKS